MCLVRGAQVVFDEKVFNFPWAPHYDAYRDHIFEIVEIHYEEVEPSFQVYQQNVNGQMLEITDICFDEPSPHYELRCISAPAVRVNGYVHGDELILK